MHVDIREALRYLGADPDGVPEALRKEVSATATKLEDTLQPRYTYRMCTLEKRTDGIFLPEATLLLTGQTAKTMLEDCDRAVLLLCTLGLAFDTMIRGEQARDMAQSVILDACGSALVEAGCDAAQQELSAKFPQHYLTDRFSPGYGDLPLDLQPQICAALDAGRRLGVHVSQSFLMNPSKSVTAVIGLSDRPQMARIRGCAYCNLRERCSLRKGGRRCEL